MNSTKWYKNPEMVVALSALLIGIVTAFTSIYSAYVDREYARASVWPKLELARSFGDNSFSYIVSNNGTGPALIKYARVNDGTKYIKVWAEIELFMNIFQSHIGNRTLPPQSTITPLLYKGDNTKSILKADYSISIEVCYCSIYEECWVVDRNNRPTAVESCSIDEKQVFSQ